MQIKFDQFKACAPIFLDGRMRADRLELERPQATESGFPIDNGMPERGRPFVIRPDLSIHDTLRDFVDFVRSDAVSKKTASDYLSDLIVFERYLRESRGGKSLLEATTEDTRAYRLLLVDGPPDFRCARATWCRIEAALGRFYAWLSDEVDTTKTPPKTSFRQKGTLPELTVKWITLAEHVLFRNVGLLGLTPSGTRDPNFRGRNPLRNAAFAEFLLTTGSRLTEASSLLVDELPQPDSWAFKNARHANLNYPEQITKWRTSRRVPYPRRVAVGFIDPYLREERLRSIEKWRRSGAAHERPDYIVAWRTPDGRIVLRGESKKPRHVATLSIDERRRLILLPEKDAPLSTAEPAALWLGEAGDPMDSAAWESVYRRAVLRLARFGILLDITPHTDRHSFAVHWLSRLIFRNADLMNKEWQEVKDDRSLEIFRRITRNPLRRVQLWLGHQSSETTEKYLTFVDDAIEAVEATTAIFDEILGGLPEAR